MENKNLVDFLLYSYFGIENEEELNDPEKAVKKCAHRAYLDLARTIKYTYSDSELKNKSQEERKKYKHKKELLIEKVCEDIISEINSNSFDTWHSEKCLSIIDMMKDSNEIVNDFTYGQAQKWLNMTLKYCWLLGLLGDNFDEKNLHVPIDSYIIEAVQSTEDYGLGITDCKITSWSSWDDKGGYEKLQESIKNSPQIGKYKSPIEWESKVWIEIAKKNATK